MRQRSSPGRRLSASRANTLAVLSPRVPNAAIHRFSAELVPANAKFLPNRPTAHVAIRPPTARVDAGTPAATSRSSSPSLPARSSSPARDEINLRMTSWSSTTRGSWPRAKTRRECGRRATRASRCPSLGSSARPRGGGDVQASTGCWRLMKSKSSFQPRLARRSSPPPPCVVTAYFRQSTPHTKRKNLIRSVAGEVVPVL